MEGCLELLQSREGIHKRPSKTIFMGGKGGKSQSKSSAITFSISMKNTVLTAKLCTPCLLTKPQAMFSHSPEPGDTA